jgi:5'-nucleotidase
LKARLPPWHEIDTVLLDMDGTLLDLRFDNYFWLELLPQRYAARHGLTPEGAQAVLAPRFAAKQGTLDWYCTDFWTQELSLDIAQLKHEVRERVCFLPGAEEFLRQVRARGPRMALVTNAHRDSLAVKTGQTGVIRYFDAVVSSHDFGVPKESARFWVEVQARLEFDSARTLFVDDSLAVLRAARAHGIGHIYAVSRPDSAFDRRTIEEFASVEAIGELLASDF